MSSTSLRGRARGREGHRGAAAVEAALVISFFLVPILVGVVTVGEKLWRAQKVDAYAVRIPAGAVSGSNLSCAELVERVKATVAHNVNNLADTLPDIGVEQVVVDVVEVLPTVGVVVQVGIRSSAVDSLTGDPTGAGLLSETTLRLSHVSVSTESC